MSYIEKSEEGHIFRPLGSLKVFSICVNYNDSATLFLDKLVV